MSIDHGYRYADTDPDFHWFRFVEGIDHIGYQQEYVHTLHDPTDVDFL